MEVLGSSDVLGDGSLCPSLIIFNILYSKRIHVWPPPRCGGESRLGPITGRPVTEG